jgi:hypothetical protein
MSAVDAMVYPLWYCSVVSWSQTYTIPRGVAYREMTVPLRHYLKENCIHMGELLTCVTAKGLPLLAARMGTLWERFAPAGARLSYCGSAASYASRMQAYWRLISERE